MSTKRNGIEDITAFYGKTMCDTSTERTATERTLPTAVLSCRRNPIFCQNAAHTRHAAEATYRFDTTI